MWRVTIAAAVAVIMGALTCGCGSKDERRPAPEARRTPPGQFEGSAPQAGTPPQSTNAPPADD